MVPRTRPISLLIFVQFPFNAAPDR
jgi:hypothetical protein